MSHIQHDVIVYCVHSQTKMDEPNQSTYRRRSQAISKSVSVPIVTSPSPTDEQSKSDTVNPQRRASEPSQPGDGLLKGEFVEIVSDLLSVCGHS